MSAPELHDLEDILDTGRRLNALEDCLQLLRQLPWKSSAEKAAVWRALPESLRRWLQQSHQAVAS